MTKHSTSKGGGGGKGGSGGKGSSPMSKSDSARIQSAGAKNSGGVTHISGFDVRAQSVADKGTTPGKK